MLSPSSGGIVKKFSKYVVVGVIAFVIDLGFLLLLAPHLHVVLANTVAFVVANAANFVLGHVWVFQRPLATVTWQTYSKVLMVSVVGLAINDALVWLGAVVVGLSLVVAKVIATLAGLVWNYVARIAWVYPQQGAP